MFRVGAKVAQIWTATAACLGLLVAGTVLGYTSFAIPSLLEYSAANGTLTVSPEETAWIGSLVPLGALFGSLFGGLILSIVGRRRTMLLIIAPVFTVGWILVAAAVHLSMIYIGRLVGGLGVGLGITSAAIMVMETSQVSLRGYLGALPQIMIVTGILLSYIVGAFVDWSWLAWISLTTVIPYVLLLLPVPESPVWLLSHRGREQALESLTWLRGGDTQVADQELTALEEGVSEAKTSSGHPIFLLRQLPYLKAFLVAIGLMLFQQMTGVNAVVFYTVQIFQDSGSNMDPNVATIVVGAGIVLATLVGAVLVERAGRRPLLTISSLFQAVSMAALGAYFYMKENGSDPPGWLPLLSMALYVIFFSIGYGPLAWLVAAEILPVEIMSAVNPIAIAINWGCVFYTTFTFILIVNSINTYGAFWLYGSVALLGVLFSFFCVPETKGLTPDQIRKIFYGDKSKTDVVNQGGLLDKDKCKEDIC